MGDQRGRVEQPRENARTASHQSGEEAPKALRISAG